MPSTHRNAESDAGNRPQQAAFCYDPAKFDTYLEELGIDYRHLKPAP